MRSPSSGGRRRSRVEPFTRRSTACSASFGPIARAASRPDASSGSSSSEESGRTTFIAQENTAQEREAGWSRELQAAGCVPEHHKQDYLLVRSGFSLSPG